MKQRIQQLRTQINHHNHLYHILNRPEISDQQFDIMFEKLLELERDYPEHTDPNSPTQRVGSDLTHNLPRLPHPTPMLSIQSYYEPEKLLRAMGAADSLPDGQAGDPLIITPKYDGIAIELTYENGSLKHALTRGNGNTGGNVTPNARTIKQIPLSLSSPMPHAPCSLLVLRGEIYVTHAQLKRINRARKKEKKEPFPNCRTAAATLLKAKRSSTTAAANLSAVFFYVETSGHDPASATSHHTSGHDPASAAKQPHTTEQFSLLELLHLPTPETHTAATPAEALQIAEQIAATQYPFPTDGAVIKLNNPSGHGSASAAKQPGVWAYKPNNAVWETTCRFVTYTVSKTGKITALAHFRSFTHNGTEFSKAVIPPQLAPQLKPRQTLHIQITGGIIPKVIKPLMHSGIHALMHCPLCHQPLTNSRCTNTTWCPAFGHTSEIVKQHTSWQHEFPVFKYHDGYGIYIAATQGHNAILVQREPRKHDMVLLTDTLDTAALVGVTIGQLEPGPFTWDDEP